MYRFGLCSDSTRLCCAMRYLPVGPGIDKSPLDCCRKLQRHVTSYDQSALCFAALCAKEANSAASSFRQSPVQRPTRSRQSFMCTQDATCNNRHATCNFEALNHAAPFAESHKARCLRVNACAQWFTRSRAARTIEHTHRHNRCGTAHSLTHSCG